MRPSEPYYTLLSMGEGDWRFEESAELQSATEKFDEVLEKHGSSPKITSHLRKFLNGCSYHIDALHHYAMRKLEEGKPLDAYAFSQTAIAIAQKAFPPEFIQDGGTLSGGWIENRPFLRALHGLMLAQKDVFDRNGAIESARELLAFDPQDRMGARLSLPIYLLEEGRNREALNVFLIPGFEDTFGPVDYLKALALLRLGKDEEARESLESCLEHYPHVARFTLEPLTPEPDYDGSGWGIVSGSPYEGWYYGLRFSHLWRTPKNAKAILSERAKPLADAGWPNRFEK